MLTSPLPDLSSRLKRPGKLGSRSSKTASTSSPISAPPKAAIAAGKGKKEDLHRRKNGLNEMLLQVSAKEGGQLSSSSQSAADDDDDQLLSADISDPSLNSIDEMMQNERVAELEKALAVALSKQKSMTDDIERLRNHETVYRGAMEGYKQQLSDEQGQRYSLHSNSGPKEFEQETDRRRSWGKERMELQEQIYELQGKVAELQSDLLDRDAMWKMQWERERTDRIMERNQLGESLHAAEKEAQDRRKQLLDLKQSISALTRMESQVTDSELTERMDQLYHRTREWVISNFRRSKLSTSRDSENTKSISNRLTVLKIQTLAT